MKDYIAKKINELFEEKKNVAVEIPPRDNMGDYSVQCASLRDDTHNNPIDIANMIKDNFNDDKKYFKEIKVMGPYVNFYLDYEVFSKLILNEIESNEKYGSKNQGKNEGLLIEHTSINPNAEPHIGRCRNSLIGDFLSNLYKFTGYNVERHYLINDLGKKIALLVIGIEKYGLDGDDFGSILDVYVKISNEAEKDETVEKQAFDYLEKVENGDEELINKFKTITDKCVEGQMKIFDKLDIHFDVFTHESDYVYSKYLDDILKRIDEKGKLKKDELGRYYVDLSDYDIPTREPVLVLTRSNGTSLYPIKDIAYTMHKIDLNDKNNFIVLGEDQAVYMKQIQSVLDILGYKSPKLISYSYVLLNGDKMSTSEGTVVMMTDFVKEVEKTLKEEFKKRDTEIDSEKLRILTNACIKFTMLNVSKNKIVNFNLDTATSFTGESGMYILYSLVRIKSILKNNSITSDELRFTHDIENKIVKELSYFEEIVDGMLTTTEAANLTKYIFSLAQDFSKFYEEVNIKDEKDEVLKSSRLRLLKAVERVLENSLTILGIKSVDEM